VRRLSATFWGPVSGSLSTALVLALQPWLALIRNAMREAKRDEVAWPKAPEEVGHDHQDGSAEAV
jgi:hypothetical protein